MIRKLIQIASVAMLLATLPPNDAHADFEYEALFWSQFAAERAWLAYQEKPTELYIAAYLDAVDGYEDAIDGWNLYQIGGRFNDGAGYRQAALSHDLAWRAYWFLYYTPSNTTPEAYPAFYWNWIAMYYCDLAGRSAN